MKKSPYDGLAVNQAHESIAIRLESFGDAFERLARTAEQLKLAEKFKGAVAAPDFASVPLIAADLEPLANWMKGYFDRFEKWARSPQEKELLSAFKEFIDELTSSAVKDVFQRPLVNKLVEEMADAMAHELSDGIPFAKLSQAGKEELLAVAIDWTDYINRGLIVGAAGENAYEGVFRIIENAIAGKPSELWIAQHEESKKLGDAIADGEQRIENLSITDLKEASRRSRGDKEQTVAADRSTDKTYER